MWVRTLAGSVAGFGAGVLLALAVLVAEGGPDVSSVGTGFVRAVAALGGVCLAVGIITTGAVAARRGRRAGLVLICWVGLGLGAGLFVTPIVIFAEAGNITDATGGTSPGSSWGVLLLVLLGMLVGLVSGLGLGLLLRQIRAAHQQLRSA